VLSPDRTRLYTLYLHQGDHQHTRDLLPGRRGADGRAVHAFVHMLSLAEGWAYCLDLPDPFGLHPAGAHALTISPDGRRLYIGETTTKQIAIADTESLTVTKVATMPDDQPAGDGTVMSTSPDGNDLYLGSSNVLRRLDSATLRVDGAWAMPAAVRGLAVSPDGRQVLLGQTGSPRRHLHRPDTRHLHRRRPAHVAQQHKAVALTRAKLAVAGHRVESVSGGVSADVQQPAVFDHKALVEVAKGGEIGFGGAKCGAGLVKLTRSTRQRQVRGQAHRRPGSRVRGGSPVRAARLAPTEALAAP
jgi:hypothetical protein